MKKTQRKILVKKLDELSKEVVRQRDGNTCQRCQKWCEGSGRHVSHVIPVSGGHRLRWDVQNMKILCYHCHINWWHKNPMKAYEWFSTAFPERWEYLQEQEGMYKFTITELEELVVKLKSSV